MTLIIGVIFTILAQMLFVKSFKDLIPTVCMMSLMVFSDHSELISQIVFIDEVSKNMIFLSIFVFLIMMMMINLKGKIINVLFTFWIMILFFSSSSFIMMFIMFESSLVPIMFLMMMYGVQPERLMAIRYMLLYTTLTSVPLLIIIIHMMNFHNFTFMPLFNMSMTKNVGCFLFVGMLAAFLVKIPMFLVHTWLPKAHVEAPVEGSMILAGIMLKMGVFGVIRMISVFYSNSMMLNNMFISLFILGSILSCWISISVDDMKMNVAFSSVGHMNFMMTGLMSMKVISLKSCILIMIGHGFCSSLLFFMITEFYSKTNSRSFIISKGCLNYYPVMNMVMFISWVINLACPPSISFTGEILCMSSILSYLLIMLPLVLSYIVMNSFFCMLSYGIMSHSNTKINFKNCGESIVMYIVSFSLITPLIMVFFASSIFIS